MNEYDHARRRLEQYPLRDRLMVAAKLAVRDVGVEVQYRRDLVPGVYATGGRKRIIAPPPTSIGGLCSVLHECGHVALRHNAPGTWRDEVAACQWALDEWDRHALPDRDQACFSLGEPLSGYLQNALRDGTATLAEIEAETPDELIVYRQRLRNAAGCTTHNPRGWRAAC